MGCSDIMVVLVGHLRTSTAATGSIFRCLPSLPIIMLPVGSAHVDVLAAICPTARLLILLPIASSVASLTCIGDTSGSSCPRCRRGMHLIQRVICVVAALVLRLIVLLVLCMLLHLIDPSD